MTRRQMRRIRAGAERRPMQRIRRVRENGSGVQDAPFDLFEEERPAVRGHGVRRDGSDFPAWNAEDLFREEGSSPAGRHADPGDGYGDDAY